MRNVVLRLTPLLRPFVRYASRFQVHLVAEHDKRKMIGIPWTGLDQEFVAPRFQVLERIGSGHVKDEHTAVGAPVEGDAQRLEALLAGRVPDLSNGLRWSKRGSDKRSHIENELYSVEY